MRSKFVLWKEWWNNCHVCSRRHFCWLSQEPRTEAQAQGREPDICIAHVALLRSCAKQKDLRRGTAVHDDLLRRGLLHQCLDALVTMYAKCGALAKAKELFDMHQSSDVFTWTDLMAGFAENGQSHDALHYFDQMQQVGLPPDALTYSCILKAIGSIRAPDTGEKIHVQIAKQGLLNGNLLLGTALVDMYGKCGELKKAGRVLDELPDRDSISWNALIGGYGDHGKGAQAINCLERMQGEGLSPDSVTFLCILKACGRIQAAKKGQEIHDEVVKRGLLGDDVMVGNALVDMYAECGALEEAQQVLDKLAVRDVVSWNSLISGYVQQHEGAQALGCFERMQQEGLFPNGATFVCILKACGSIGAADKGKNIHDAISKQGLLKDDVALGNAVVDMYAKCGASARARQVLNELPRRDVISWNAMIAGYAEQSQCVEALNCLAQMVQDGLFPNAATFSSVLSACTHLSLVEDAHLYFANMSTKYGIMPDLEQYTCIVDLLGSAGHLERAVGVIEKMPSPNSIVWCALLSACRKWGNVEVAKWAFEQAVQADKSDGALYILMAQIYAAARIQEAAENIEAMAQIFHWSGI